MQTFLPYPDFHESAFCLDNRRLGKQRVEAAQILKALSDGGGWSNHPATKMWAGYEDALKLYFNYVVREWIARGYKNNYKLFDVSDNPAMPPWFGDEKFHSAHRAALLAKDFEWYSHFNWDEDAKIDYYWPSAA